MCGSSCWLLVSTRGVHHSTVIIYEALLLVFICLISTFSGRNTDGRLCIRPCSLGSWFMGISRTPDIWKGKYQLRWVSLIFNTTERLYSHFPWSKINPDPGNGSSRVSIPACRIFFHRGDYTNTRLWCVWHPSGIFWRFPGTIIDFWLPFWESNWLFLFICDVCIVCLFYWTLLFCPRPL